MHKINQIIASTIFVFLVIAVTFSSALEWIQLQSGDELPQNAVHVLDTDGSFVGRSRHYDEVLPAEINETVAVIHSCNRNIVKHQYEILVTPVNNTCRWQTYSQLEGFPENIVRGGTSSNGEPTYIGGIIHSAYNNDRYDHNRIKLINLTLKTKNKWSSDGVSVLVCDDSSNWIDVSSENVPNNTVYGGLSEDKHHIYVARLKSGCSIIPGQVTPELAVASAIYKHERLQSKYCQVLVGKNEYSWVAAYNGHIPDYAVVGGKDSDNELMYLARINKTLGYIMPSIAAKFNTTYEILVRNVV